MTEDQQSELLAQLQSEYLNDTLNVIQFLDLWKVVVERPSDYLEERCCMAGDPPDTKRFDRFRRLYGRNPTFADMVKFLEQQHRSTNHTRKDQCRNMKPVSIPSRIRTN